MNPPRRPTRRGRRRGLVIADVVMGLTIVGVLGVSLIIAVARGRQASDRVADMRTATAIAEHALAQMASGRKPAGDEVSVELTSTSDHTPDEAPAGHAWVRVRAKHNGRSTTLIGLVPRESVPPSPADEGGRP